MKKVFVLLFLILISKTYSQNTEITITLKDEETKQNIEGASVFVVKGKQYHLSNSDGKVSFSVKGISNIQISHTGYNALTVRTSTLKETDNVVYLKAKLAVLEELVVTKQHPQKILASLIENSSNKLTIPARLKVYSREFFKLNGEYKNYNDGLMNFQLTGRPKKIETKILVEQNRSFGLEAMTDNVSDELLGYNLNNIMENYYNFKYLLLLLEPKAKKDFDFFINASATNDDYYTLKAIPFPNSKGLLDDFAITYDRKKKIIVEVSAIVSPMTIARVVDKTSSNAKNIYKSIFNAKYRIDGNDYYLSSSQEEIGFEQVKKGRASDIEVRSYLVTTNFSNQNFSFKETEVFKDKTLFNKKNEILTNYWHTSGLVPTDEEEEIIQNLEERHK